MPLGYAAVSSYLNSLVRITDDTNEQAENHVNEERNKRIEVDLAENPGGVALSIHLSKRHEHVVTID